MSYSLSSSDLNPLKKADVPHPIDVPDPKKIVRGSVFERLTLQNIIDSYHFPVENLQAALIDVGVTKAYLMAIQLMLAIPIASVEEGPLRENMDRFLLAVHVSGEQAFSEWLALPDDVSLHRAEVEVLGALNDTVRRSAESILRQTGGLSSVVRVDDLKLPDVDFE